MTTRHDADGASSGILAQQLARGFPPQSTFTGSNAGNDGPAAAQISIGGAVAFVLG